MTELLNHALNWVEQLGFAGPVIFFLIYIVACVLFIPGSALTLGAGAIFGVIRGSIIVSVASTLGATAAFLVGRYVARDWVARKIAKNAKFAAVDRAVGNEGWKIVGLTRLSPVFPFSLLNYAYGLTKVSLRDYVLASWIGMIPGTVMYVYIGSLARLGVDAEQTTTAQTALKIVGLLATVVVTVYVTRIARKALKRKVDVCAHPPTSTFTLQPSTFPIAPLDEHNRELLANVHPSDWINPDPQPVYNLVVIGAGTAGLITAAGAAGLGAKVALVERHLMGGDCLNVGLRTNETIFNLTELPKHLIVIGGGPIGCELAQAFRRLGSEVSIVQRGRLLPKEDPDASALIARVFEREGIRVLLNAKVKRAFNTDGRKQVVVERDDKEEALIGNEILIGAGRAPNVEGLNLEAAGVEYDPRLGIKVNDNLCTTNPRIFAAGDCCMARKFTHAADAAARIVIQNALFKGRAKLSALTMPWCTYTDPEVAHVGLYEADAKDRGIETDTFRVEMAEIDRARTDGETEGFIKVLVRKGTDKILGATIVSAHAGEMISEITTAMAAKAGLGTLAKVIHPYPTQAEAIKRVADAYNRTRLTPRVAALLKWWVRHS